MGCGITDIIVNIHHFPDMMMEALLHHPYANHIHISDERAYLRDTAGGLKFAEPFWEKSDCLLLYNVDILSDIDLNKLLDFHLGQQAEATLAVRDRTTQRYFLFDRQQNQLCGWRNVKTGESILARNSDNPKQLAFSGIHVMNTAFARLIPSVEKSSVTPFYLSMAEHHQIMGYEHTEGSWQDVGKFDEFRNLLS